MSELAVVHRRGGLPARAIAGAIPATETFVAGDLEEAIAPIERARDGAGDRLVVVADESPYRELAGALADRGLDDTVRVEPRVGDGLGESAATRVLAAAAGAALASPRPGPDEPAVTLDGRSIVVVGDAGIAADLAIHGRVTLLAAEPPGRRLEGVDVVHGRPVGLVDGAGGPSLLVDGPDGAERLSPEQLVWPGYDGDRADERFVHTARTGVVADVLAVVRDRVRDPVVVDREVCAVGRRGQPGCDACERRCPYDAIEISIEGDGAVAVDPVDCIDCGACLAACPTEAIASPRALDLEALGRAVEVAVGTATEGTDSRLPFVGDGPEPIVLAFVTDAVEPAATAALAAEETPTVPIAVRSASRIPPALVTYAVAAGAAGVVLVGDPGEPYTAYERIVEPANRTLADLGVGERCRSVASVDPGEIAAAIAAVDGEPVDATEELLGSGHRRAHEFAAAAIRALGSDAERVFAESLGRVTVDADGCTLCEACSELCPTGAIDQPDASTLTLDAADCVGCGLCLGCPEDVIAVDDRVDPAELSAGRRTVVEAEAITCRECGREFASAAGMASVEAALEDAGVPTDVGLDVCPDCRRGSF